MRFAKAYVEITNACDLSCSFCPHRRGSAAFMAEEDFARVLGQLSGKTPLLYFHVLGEPLLHPRLGAFLALGAESGFKVNLTTNGTRLAECRETLLSSPALRQVNVSLHSLSGRSGETEAYLAEAARFTREAQEAGILVSLRLWNYGPGAPAGTEELRRAVERSFGLRLPDALDGGGFRAFRGIRLGPRAYLNAAEAFEWPSLEGPEIGETGFCRGLRDQLGILVDGTVVPCCLDSRGDARLGNLLKEDLDGILGSERARAIYDGFSERRIAEALCRRCSYRLRFDSPGGDRANVAPLTNMPYTFPR